MGEGIIIRRGSGVKEGTLMTASGTNSSSTHDLGFTPIYVTWAGSRQFEEDHGPYFYGETTTTHSVRFQPDYTFNSEFWEIAWGDSEGNSGESHEYRINVPVEESSVEIIYHGFNINPIIEIDEVTYWFALGYEEGY